VQLSSQIGSTSFNPLAAIVPRGDRSKQMPPNMALSRLGIFIETWQSEEHHGLCRNCPERKGDVQ
jgi:hypothetical protein